MRHKTYERTAGRGSWSNWTYVTRPGGGAPVPYVGASSGAVAPSGGSITAVGGHFLTSGGFYLPRFNSFMDVYASPFSTPRLGQPFFVRSPVTTTWAEMGTPSTLQGTGFEPRTAFTWRNGTTQRINVFGVSNQPRAGGLREHYWDGGTWRYTDHGHPLGAVLPGRTLRVGPHSSVWTQPTGLGEGFVFVTSDDGRLFARVFHTPGCTGHWCWESLGRPARVAAMRTAVAFTHHRAGQPRIRVFVAGYRSDLRRWRLYSRERTASSWSAWMDQGGVDTCDGEGFDMVAVADYWDRGVHRPILFGQTDIKSWPRCADGGGRVLTYYYDGSRWRWGHSAHVDDGAQSEVWPEYNDKIEIPIAFRVMSAAHLGTNQFQKSSMFGQDILGRTWEYTWEGSRWAWKEHF